MFFSGDILAKSSPHESAHHDACTQNSQGGENTSEGNVWGRRCFKTDLKSAVGRRRQKKKVESPIEKAAPA